MFRNCLRLIRSHSVPWLLSVPFCLFFSLNTQDSETKETARDIVEREVRSTLSSRQQPVFSTRRADLEQELIALQYVVKPPERISESRTRVGCIEIVETALMGFKVDQGIITAASVDLDDDQIWRTAYDCDNKQVFRLYGYPDDAVGFGKLIATLGINPRSESDALIVTSAFLKLASRDSNGTVVNDEISLMAAFAKDYNGPRDWKSFIKDWGACPNEVIKQLTQPVASTTAVGYRVTFFTYSSGQIDKESIIFHLDGSSPAIERRRLFAWNKVGGRGQPK